VLILDAHLPDYSGLETFNIIKKEISISIPCIFISGDISKELQINLINANAYTLIPKPINVNIFRDSVEQVIEKYYWK
jgi:DNA-binding response OmpR family regulator